MDNIARRGGRVPHGTAMVGWGLILLASAALAAPSVAEGQAPPMGPLGSQGQVSTISVEEVRVGQKGYGLTVLQGTEPARFEVEVLGVMHNTSPDTSYILARLTGNGVEETGVAAGMSGSPVYLDGRLAGAVAFSWSFTREAIGGITPIAGMRRLVELPRPQPLAAPSGVNLRQLVSGEIPGELFESSLERLRPKLAGDALPAIHWATMGFGERSQALLRRTLGSVSTGGRTAAAAAGGTTGVLPPEESSLEGGSAVAAVLVDGDLSIAAYGTVTERRGGSILAFGHPFLGLGPVEIPMAEAEVVTVLASSLSSFKISNLGARVGAFEQDRLLGIQGRLGVEVRTLPMVLKIAGSGGVDREFHMEVARIPGITPLLVSVVASGGLEAAAYAAGRQRLDLAARFEVKGLGELAFEQTFEGPRAVTEAASYLAAYTGFLLENEFAEVELERVEVELSQTGDERTVLLAGAHASRTRVAPGESLRLYVDLSPYRGERMRRTLSLKLPEDLPDGRYSLLVGDGASASTARAGLEPRDPETLEQALEILRGRRTRRELVVLGLMPAAGLSVAGELLPRLPGSAASLLTEGDHGDSERLRFAVVQEEVEPLGFPIEGLLRVDLDVRSRGRAAAGPRASKEKL